MQSDTGSEFVNQILHHLMQTLTVDHRLTLTYHPEERGLAEQLTRRVMDLLQNLLEGETLLESENLCATIIYQWPDCN